MISNDTMIHDMNLVLAAIGYLVLGYDSNYQFVFYSFLMS